MQAPRAPESTRPSQQFSHPEPSRPPQPSGLSYPSRHPEQSGLSHLSRHPELPRLSHHSRPSGLAEPPRAPQLPQYSPPQAARTEPVRVVEQPRRAEPATVARPAEPARSPGDRRARSRRLPVTGPAVRSKAVLIVATLVVIGLGVLAFAWPAAAHWIAKAPDSAWANEADVLGLQAGGALGIQARLQPEVVSSGLAVAPLYLNPFRNVGALVPERIDQGVDFSGSGPVYALGDGIVTNATAYSPGWGGGWITYQLTDGPDAGLMVYLAENVTPTVVVGQHVTPSTVVGNMFEGGGGIETGWSQASGLTAESQLTEAGGIGGGGPFPTAVGVNFDELLVSLGAPVAPNRYQQASGILPAKYPTP